MSIELRNRVLLSILFRFNTCQQIGIALDETVTEQDLDDIMWIFRAKTNIAKVFPIPIQYTSNVSYTTYIAN